MKKTTRRPPPRVLIKDRDPKTLTYAQQLQRPEWLAKRNEIVQRDGNCCTCCKRKNNLAVHHVRYISDGRSAWEYPDNLLVTLCAFCHKLAHEGKLTLYSDCQFQIKDEYELVYNNLTSIDKSVITRLAKLKKEINQNIPWTETIINMIKNALKIDGRQLVLSVDRLKTMGFLDVANSYLIVKEIEFVTEEYIYTFPE